MKTQSNGGVDGGAGVCKRPAEARLDGEGTPRGNCGSTPQLVQPVSSPVRCSESLPVRK